MVKSYADFDKTSDNRPTFARSRKRRNSCKLRWCCFKIKEIRFQKDFPEKVGVTLAAPILQLWLAVMT